MIEFRVFWCYKIRSETAEKGRGRFFNAEDEEFPDQLLGCRAVRSCTIRHREKIRASIVPHHEDQNIPSLLLNK
jgi:hypothetical protein